MVAIVSGSSLGLFNSSAVALGRSSNTGPGMPGRSGEQTYVNAATGNLIVQQVDERLNAVGLDLSLVRTYNSQGVLDGDNNDNWRIGVYERLATLTGTINTAGSTITKTFGDGADVIYTYDAVGVSATFGKYISTNGNGAHDALSYSTSALQWTWTDGSGRNTETYDWVSGAGKLLNNKDTDGNAIIYTYTGSLLTSIADASGQTTYLDYSGNNLTQIRVVSSGQTQTVTRYYYDASNRLRQVVVDLTPTNNADTLLLDNNADGLYEGINNQAYVTTYTYQGATKLITSITQSDGTSVSFTYDTSGRIKTYTDGLNRTTTFNYPTTTPAAEASLITSALTTPTVGWSGASTRENSATAAGGPVITCDASGNAFELWVQGSDIWVSRYDKATDTWVTAPALDGSNTNTVSDDWLSVDAITGNAIATWVQSDGIAASVAYCAFYNAANKTWSSAAKAYSTNNAIVAISGVINAKGQAGLTWVQTDSGVDNLYGAFYDGSTWNFPTNPTDGSVIPIDASATSVDHPSLAIDGEGNLTAVWRQANNIAIRRYVAGTAAWDTPGVLLESSATAASDQRVAFDQNGNGIAVWCQGTDVYARRFTKAGNFWGAQVTLDLASNANTTYATSLAVDPITGDAVVAWAQSDGSAISTYANLYNAATDTWSGAQNIDTSTEVVANTAGSVVAAIRGGKAAVAWLQSDGTRNSLWASRWNGSSWSARESLEASNNVAAQPFVAIDVFGDVIATWKQSDGTANSIYTNRYNADITPYFTIPASPNWTTLATTLYGNGALATELQEALGNPAPGTRVTNLPARLADTVQTDVVDPLGRMTSYVTDSKGRLVKVLSPAVNGVRMGVAYYYDTDGNLLQTREGSEADLLNGLGNITVFRYDASGDVILTRDAMGNTVTRTYSTTNQLLTETQYLVRDPDAAGIGQAQAPLTTRYVYDDATGETLSHLRFTIDADGRVTEHQYNAAGQRLTTLKYSGALYTALTFTEAALATWAGSNRANVERLDYSYDFRSQLSSTSAWAATNSSGAGTGTASITRYIYDQRGNLLQKIDPRGSSSSPDPTKSALPYAITYAYDGLGRVLMTTEWLSSDGASRTTFNQYDDAGNRTITTLAAGNGVKPGALTAPVVGWGAPWLLEGDTTAVSNVQVRFDKNGNGMAIWQEGNSVYYATYSKATSVWSQPDGVVRGQSLSALSFAMSPNGNALVTWRDTYGNPTGAIYAKAYVNGVWSDGLLVPSTAGDTLDPVGAINDAGQAMVIYRATTSGTTPPYYLYAARYTALNTWQGATLIESNANDLTAPTPTLALDAQGNATVLWLQKIASADSYASLYLARYTASTNTWSTPDATKLESGPNPISTPKIAFDQNGNGVAVWIEANNLYAKSYTKSNDTWSAVKLLENLGSAVAANSVVLSMSPNGTAIVTWLQGTSNIYARRYVGGTWQNDWNGADMGDAVSYSSGSTYNVSASINDSGQAAVGFLQVNSGFLNAFVTRYTGSWGAITPVETSNNAIATSAASGPQVAIDSSGNTSAVWAQSDGTVASLYTNRFVVTDNVPYYTIPSGADWNQIANDLYGTSGVGTPLYVAMGYRDPVPGERLYQSELPGSLTDPNAGILTTTSTYNKAGELTSVMNTGAASVALGTTSYTYDSSGNLRIVTDPSNLKQFALYDEANRKVADIDANGTLAEYVYDSQSQLVKTVRYADLLPAAVLKSGDPNSLIDAANSPTTVTLAAIKAILPTTNGRTKDQITRAVFNSAGQLTYMIDAAGGVAKTCYDGAGRVTDAIGYATSLTTIPANVNELQATTTPNQLRDPANGNLYSVALDPTNDRRTRAFHDNAGNVIGALDAAGYLTENVYNGAGELIQTIGYANKTSATLWLTGTFAELRASAGTDTETATDPERDALSYFFYDGQHRQIGSLDAEGYFSEAQFDVAGKVTQSLRYDRAVTYTPGTSTFQTLKTAASAANPAVAVHGTSYQYDGAGRVLREATLIAPTSALPTLTEDTVTVYSYDIENNLISTSRSGAGGTRTVQARYDALGRITQDINAEGAAAKFNAALTDADRELIWKQYGTQYQYDAAGRKVSETRIAYDKDANTSITEVTYFYYDNDGSLRFTVNPMGEVTENRYNDLEQLKDRFAYTTPISTSGLKGGLLTSALITQLTPAADSKHDTHTSYQYTLSGAVARVTTTLNASENGDTQFGYNAFGQEQSRLEAISASTTRTTNSVYDTRGLVTSVNVEPSGLNLTTSATYDAFGRVSSQKDARNKTIKIEYDRLGRAVATVDALSGRHTTTYDAFDRVLITTDALGNQTKYAYDDTKRSVAITTPEGVKVVTIRNEFGETLSVTAATGNTTTYKYDLNGRLTLAWDSQGGTTKPLEARAYDSLGRELNETDARGTVTKFTFDAANRVLTRIVDPTMIKTANDNPNGLNLTTSYAYDGQGHTLRVTASNGCVTKTDYDNAGRVIQVIVDPKNIVNTGDNPNGADLTTNYTFDLEGRTLTVTQGVGTTVLCKTQYVYDRLGRRTQEIVDPGTTPKLNLLTQYRYDWNGNLARKIDANGNSTWYVYDAKNRLTHTIDALGDVTELSYDAADRIIATRRYTNRLALAASTTDVVTAAFASGVWSFAINIGPASTLVASATDRFEQSYYDKDGRVAYAINAAGTVTERKYDPISGLLVRTRTYANPLKTSPGTTFATIAALQKMIGLVVQNDPSTANAAGNDLNTVSPNDRCNWNAYDLRGRIAFSVDGVGAVTQYQYDNGGNVTSQTAYANLRAITGAMDTGALNSWVNSSSTQTYNRTPTSTSYVVPASPGGGVITWANVATALYTSPRVADELQALYPGVALVQGATLTNLPASLTDTLSIANDPGNQTTRFWYDTTNRNRFTLDAEGYLHEVRFNDTARTQNTILYATKPAAIAAGATVDDVKTKIVTDTAKDETVTAVFDKAGRMIRAIDAEGYDTKYVYDACGKVIETDQQLDKKATQTYAVTRHYFDAANREIYTLSPEGYVARADHDADGNVTVRTLYDTKIAAPTSGNPVPASGDTSHVTRYRYNAANQLTRESRELQSYNSIASSYAVPPSGTPDWNSVAFAIYGTGLVGDELRDAMNIALNPGTTVSGFPATIADAIYTDYSYDAHGNIIQMITGSQSLDAQVTKYVYDTADRLTDTIRAAGVTETVTTHLLLDAFGNVRTRYDAYGSNDERQVSFKYDGDNRVTQEIQDDLKINGAAIVDVNSYDAFGNLTVHFDAFAMADMRTQSFTYDKRNLKTSWTNGEGDVVAYRYDAAGNQVAMMNGNLLGLLTADDLKAPGDNYYDNYYVDLRKRLGVADSNGQGMTAAQMNASANKTAYIYSLTASCSLSYYYDRNNRVVKATDARGVSTEYVFDGAGNKLETIQARGLGVADPLGGPVIALEQHTLYTYYLDGRIKTVTDPMKGLTQFEYNVLSNQTKITDANGNIRTNTYDAIGRIKTSVLTGAGLANNGLKTAYAYDQHDNVTRLTTSYGDGTDARTMTYKYNALNLKVAEFDGEGNVTNFGYDRRGNQTTIVNGNASYLIGSDVPFAIAMRKLLGYPDSYTALTETQKPELFAFCTTTFKYDMADRVTDVITPYHPDSRFPTGPVTHTDYDALGNKARVTTAYGSGYDRATQYEYDDANRVFRITAPLGGTTSFIYDGTGNQVASHTLQSADTNPDGSVKYDASNNPVRAVWIDKRFEYGARGELLAEIAPDDRAGTVRTEYYYDAIGNCVENRYAAGSATDQRSVWMKYDLNNRKTDDIDGLKNTTHYDFDAIGNRIKVTDAMGYVARYYFDAAARLTCLAAPDYAKGDTAAYTLNTFKYDSAGNKIEERIYGNRYSGTLSDTSAPTPTSGIADRLTSFVYNKSNQLIQQFTPDHFDVTANLAKYTFTAYSYDGDNHKVAEYQYANTATYLVPTTSWTTIANTLYSSGASNTAAGSALSGKFNNIALSAGVTTLSGLPASLTVSGVTYYLNLEAVPLASATNAAAPRKITYGYYPGGLLQIMTDVDGTQTGFIYDAANNKIAEVVGKGLDTGNDPNWHLTYYEYDLNNRLVRATQNPRNGPFGASKYHTTWLGIVHQFTYDVIGNVKQEEVYNESQPADGPILSAMPTIHTITQYVYDIANRRIQETRGASMAVFDLTQAAYTSAESPLLFQYGYDLIGNRTSVTTNVTDTHPKVTSFEFDKNNRLSKTTKPAVAAYTVAGDPNNQFTSAVLNPTAINTYDAVGNLIDVQDENGNHTSSYYNGNGKKVAELKADGSYCTYVYTSSGELASETHYLTSLGPTLRKLNLLASDNNRPAPASGDTGRLTRYQYDLAGRRVATYYPGVDITSVTTTSPYAHSVTVASTLASGSTYSLSVRAQVTAAEAIAIDAGSGGLHLAYRLAPTAGAWTAAGGGYGVFTDISGTGAPGFVKSSASNGDSLYTLSCSLANGTYELKLYYKDAANNEIVIEQERVLTTTASTLFTGAPIKAGWTLHDWHTYNDFGDEVISEDIAGNRTYSYYDARHRKVAAVDPLGYLSQWDYDGVGNLTSERLYDVPFTSLALSTLPTTTPPTAPVSTVYQTDRTYDVASRLIKEVAAPVFVFDPSAQTSPTTLQQTQVRPTTAYEYDAMGNLRVKTIGAGTSQAVSEYSFYNAANQLIASIDTNRAVTGFNYDNAGNLVAKVRYNGTLGANFDLESLEHGDASQTTDYFNALSALLYTNYAYSGSVLYVGIRNSTEYLADLADPAHPGVAAGTEATVYGYDALNRLSSETDLMGVNDASDDLKKAYLYDAKGNRTLSTDEEGAKLVTSDLTVYRDLRKDVGVVDATYKVPTSPAPSWRTVAKTLYNVDSDAAGTVLQNLYGLPTPNSVSILANLPSAILVGAIFYTLDLTKVTTQGSVGKAFASLSDIEKIWLLNTRTTRLAYDAMDRVQQTLLPNGGGTSFEYDDVGNLTRVYTGPMAIIATAPSNLTAAYTLQGKLTIGWRVASSGQQTWVVWDTISRANAGANLSAYVNATPFQTSTGVDMSATVTPLAAGSTVYFRVVAQDPAGNKSYSAERSLIVPALLGNAALTLATIGAADTVDANGKSLGYAIDYQYDLMGRKIASNEGDGLWRTFGLDALGHVVQTNLFGDNRANATPITTYATYDAHGRKIADMGAAVVNPAATAAGTVSYTPTAGQTIGAALSWLAAQKYGDGNLWFLIADANNIARSSFGQPATTFPTTLSLPPLTRAIERYQYDALDHQTRKTDALGFWSDTVYNAMGALISETDRLAFTKRTYVDQFGRTTGIVTPNGNASFKFYDLAGHLVKERTPMGTAEHIPLTTYAETVYTYDAFGRQVSKIDPSGTVVNPGATFQHTLTVTDTLAAGQNNVFQNSLSLQVTLSNLEKARIVGGVRLSYRVSGSNAAYTDIGFGSGVYGYVLSSGLLSYQTYELKLYYLDAFGVETLIENQNVTTRSSQGTTTLSFTGQSSTTGDYTTRYVYDNRDRLMAVKEAQGWSLAYENSTWIQDERTRLRKNRDLVTTPLSATDRSDLIGYYTTSYTYSGTNQRRTTSTFAGVTSDTYDGLGRMTRSVYQPSLHPTLDPHPVPPESVKARISTRGYDAFGNLIAETDAMNRTRRAVYGAFGRLIQAIDPDEVDDAGKFLRTGDVVNSEYDNYGRISRESGSNGKNLYKYYDAAGRLIFIDDRATQTNTTYSYTLTGQRSREVTTAPKDADGHTHNRNVRYSYDRDGQMMHWDDLETQLNENIAYDGDGNRTGVRTDDSYNPLGQNLQYGTRYLDHVYVYDYADRVISLSNRTYNSSFKEVLTPVSSYTYDVRGNRNTWTDGAGGGAKWGYAFDALNRLVQGTATAVPNDVISKRTWGYDPTGNVVSSSTANFANIVTITSSYNSFDASGTAEAYSETAKWNGSKLVSDDSHTDTYMDLTGRTTRQLVKQGSTHYTLDFTYYSDGRQKQTAVSASNANTFDYYGSGNSLYQYDANDVIHFINLGQGSSTDHDETKTYVADNEGHVLYEDHDTGLYGTRIHVVHDALREFLYANGNPVGEWSYDDTSQTQVKLDTDAYNPLVNFGTEATPSGPSNYKSQLGDTLRSIAKSTLGSESLWYVLADANPSLDSNPSATITLGTSVKIPVVLRYASVGGSSSTYIARTGDTLAGVASALFGDPSLAGAFAQANNLDPNALLIGGTTVRFPAAVQANRITADTHNVYSEAAIIGSVMPNVQAPPPKRSGDCAMVAAIIATVVISFAVGIASGGVGSAFAGAGLWSAIGGFAAVGATAGAFSGGVGLGLQAIASGNTTNLRSSDVFKAFASGAVGGAIGGIGSGIAAYAGAAAAGTVTNSQQALSLSSTARGISPYASALFHGLGAAVPELAFGSGNIAERFNFAAIGMAAVGGGLSAAQSIAAGDMSYASRFGEPNVFSQASSAESLYRTLGNVNSFLSPWAAMSETALSRGLNGTDWGTAWAGALTNSAMTAGMLWAFPPNLPQPMSSEQRLQNTLANTVDPLFESDRSEMRSENYADNAMASFDQWSQMQQASSESAAPQLSRDTANLLDSLFDNNGSTLYAPPRTAGKDEMVVSGRMVHSGWTGLGDQMDEYASYSPKLLRMIRKAKMLGANIMAEPDDLSSGSGWELNKEIRIDRSLLNKPEGASVLAHEITHFLYDRWDPDPEARGGDAPISLDDYKNYYRRSEGVAVVEEITVQREILENSHGAIDIGHSGNSRYDEIYDTHFDQALNWQRPNDTLSFYSAALDAGSEMGKLIESETLDFSNPNYAYGDLWEDNYAKYSARFGSSSVPASSSLPRPGSPPTATLTVDASSLSQSQVDQLGATAQRLADSVFTGEATPQQALDAMQSAYNEITSQENIPALREAGLPVSPSRPTVSAAQSQESVTLGSLAENFAEGLVGAAVEPVARMVDLAQMSAGVVADVGIAGYNAATGDNVPLWEPHWISDLGEQASNGVSSLELAVPEIISQNRIGNLALAGAGVYESLGSGDWNAVARMSGGLVGGALLGMAIHGSSKPSGLLGPGEKPFGLLPANASRSYFGYDYEPPQLPLPDSIGRFIGRQHAFRGDWTDPKIAFDPERYGGSVFKSWSDRPIAKWDLATLQREKIRPAQDSVFIHLTKDIDEARSYALVHPRSPWSLVGSDRGEAPLPAGDAHGWVYIFDTPANAMDITPLSLFGKRSWIVAPYELSLRDAVGAIRVTSSGDWMPESYFANPYLKRWSGSGK